MLTSIAWLPALAWAGRAKPALPLLLAQEAAADVDPAGFLVSEKYDGVRACWDGRSLRFRSGQAVVAPEQFLSRLPPVALDGELWLGHGRFEELSGLVRRQAPDALAWRQVRYMLFELPRAEGSFAARAAQMRNLAQTLHWPQLQAVEQATLADRAALRRRLDEVLNAGGEGLMLHRANASIQTGRSRDLLKLKPLHDAEAQVIAHVPGRGKHDGRLGALLVRTPQGVQFLLGTGFSDAQRASPPPNGAIVSYTHRGHTAAGVPRFANFLRVAAG